MPGARGRSCRRAVVVARGVRRRSSPAAAGRRLVGRRDGADRTHRALSRPSGARASAVRGSRPRSRPVARRRAAPPCPTPAAHGRRVAHVGAGAPLRTSALRRPRRRDDARLRDGQHVADRRADRDRRRPHRRAGRGVTRSDVAGSRLAINRLKAAKPLDGEAVDRFLDGRETPIVEGATCTFLWRGEADEVWVCQRIVNLPDRIPMRRIRGTDLWHVGLELPEGSRIEYQIEIRRGEHHERFNDPFNPKVSHSPMGSSSVCFGVGYVTPDWVLPDPEARPGELRDLVVRSRALGRDARVTLYLPARFRPSASYPLLVVHDGGDFLQYASMKTALDNLIHRMDVAGLIAAFVHPGDRLVEYANSAAHSRFLTGELLPELEASLPLAGTRAGRCLVGASVGGGGGPPPGPPGPR